MPSKQRQQQRAQRASVSQQFGALSLDKGPLPSTAHLAPPEDFSAFGGSSSAGSSVVGTPQPRSESPDLALLGTSLPVPPPPPPEPTSQPGSESPSILSTLGQKTFNGTAEMPEWMANVTGGFAKEISVLMQEMDDLRKDKQRLQMDVANLMRTLSEYSPGGQFAPAHWSHPHGTIPQEHPGTLPLEPLDPSPAPDVEVQQLVPGGLVKPGWRTVKPEPKKIQSRVVPAPHQLSAIQSGQRSTSNTSLNTMTSSHPPPAPVVAPYQHAPRALPALALPSIPSTPAHMVHSHSPQIQQHPVAHYPPPTQPSTTKGPSWASWRPGNRPLPMKPPAPQPPATVPTLFGE
ncbi:hypothetical protein M407DRAFT_23170 [Tulasnella calospora MUT 4182]|uniref:Uncharacterized protein n=1 Tax=Tulasnella calospora MUT 4182 TaxID=1051891 RepID=A0A0C3L1K2_9AGAM|nr:hypothetical protein M407DRAFT_23170 [Tulasnella calospora MUT 4182]